MHAVSAPLEADFAAFRTTGDPAALARVFDAAAPRLLLLAAHWTRDPAEAEDLVQLTFVQAVRDAAQWQPERPLLRWLSGILAHRAPDHKRAAARTDAPLDDAVLAHATATAPSPLDAASDGELLDHVSRALERLEAPYREVLTLRIVHGLEPTAIAHALARAPATVRKQLERGLQQLRGLLPAAFAGALTALLLPRRGLAAVRNHVLATAGGPVPAAALALGGMLLVTMPAVVLLAVAALALLWLRPWATPPAAPLASTAPHAAPDVAVADRAAPTTVPASAPQPATTARTLAAAATASLEVSVLREDDGTPLAGI